MTSRTKPALDATEPALNHLLSHFDQAAPPADLEARILHRLAAASSASPFSRIAAWRWPVLALCGAAAAAALLLIHSRPAPRSPAPAITPSAPLVARSEPSPLTEPHHRSSLRTTHPFVVSATYRPQQISFPAPPAPLTVQEKLLLQVAATPDPAPQEILNPVLSAQLRAAGDAEFERFIHPSQAPAAPRSN